MDRVIGIEKPPGEPRSAALSVVISERHKGKTGEKLQNAVYRVRGKGKIQRIRPCAEHKPERLTPESASICTDDEYRGGADTAPVRRERGKQQQRDKTRPLPRAQALPLIDPKAQKPHQQ